MSLQVWGRHIPWVPLGQGAPDPVLEAGWERLAGEHAWLSAGTILGLYRDGRHIPYDTDLDVGVLCHWDDEVQTADAFEWALMRTMSYEGRPMQLAYVHRKIIFDIYFFYEGVEEGVAINYNDNGVMRKPLDLVSTLEDFTWRGSTYKAPSPVEEYLEYRYGPDWRTPRDTKQPWFKDAAPGLLRPG